ncbi:MAG: YDG domain-containing protein [Sulfuritalea sp.]|nr:YDG domain-containing protein [Sulfuritalea sp.]
MGNATTAFTGTFDGLGHTIGNLSINRPTENFVGLFGYAGTGSVIKNVGLVGGSVSGAQYVGGLVGLNNTNGVINNSYSTSNVSGTYAVGGLVGVNDGPISNSYSGGTVTGIGIDVGGLAGYNYYNGIISKSYSTGSVSGSSGNVGGLVGYNYGTIDKSYATSSVSGATNVGGLVGANEGPITNSYWDTETSGKTTSAGGGIGLTTALMMQSANLAGFDFINVWNIVPGISYPYLRWQFSATPQVLSGTATGLAGGKTIQAIANGTDLAKTVTGANGFYYFALPGNSVPSGNTLATYVAGDAFKGAAAYGSAGSHVTGMAISQNTLTVAGGGVSNNSLGGAKGALASTDIPYSVSSNNLSLSSGFAFQTLSGASYTLDGNVTTIDAAQTWGGPTTMASNAILAAGIGAIAINGAISGVTPSYNLTLNTGGNVTQGAAITVAGLELLGTGGTYTLNHGSNAIIALAGNTGSVSFTESNGFDVATVNGTNGLTTTGNLALMTKYGSLMVTQAVTSTSGGNILLAAQGATISEDLNIYANVTASGGNGSIALYAGQAISQAAGTISAAGAGAIGLFAGQDYNGGTPRAGNADGDITQNSPLAIKSDDGNISLTATDYIRIYEVNADGNAAGTRGNVVLRAGDNTFGVGSGSGGIWVTGYLVGHDSVVASDLKMRATANIGNANGPDFIRGNITSLDVNTSGNAVYFAEDVDAGSNGVRVDQLVVTGTSGDSANNQGIMLAGSGGIDIAGTVSTQGYVSLSANGAVTNGGGSINSTACATCVGGAGLPGGVLLRAGSVGTDANPINIAAPLLAGTIFATGDFAVSNTGALEVGSIAHYGSATGIVMTTGSATPGHDIAVTASGTISVTQPIANKLAGKVSLLAQGTASDVAVNRAITSASGDLQFDAGNNITFSALGALASTSGNVIVRADADNGGTASGALTMTSGALIDAGSGTIALSADGNVALGSLQTTSALSNALTVTSNEGGITQNGVISVAGSTTLTAGAGTGNILLNNALNSLRDVTVNSGYDVTLKSIYNGGGVTISLPQTAGGLRNVTINYASAPSVALYAIGACNGYYCAPNYPVQLSGNLAITSGGTIGHGNYSWLDLTGAASTSTFTSIGDITFNDSRNNLGAVTVTPTLATVSANLYNNSSNANLTLTSPVTNLTLTQPNASLTLAANKVTGSLFATTQGGPSMADSITLGGQTLSGGIDLRADGAISLTGAISATSATFSSGSTISATGGVTANTFTLSSGTWTQVSATIPGFTVTDFRVAGGTFIRALGGDGSVGTPYQLADIHGVQGMGSAGMLGNFYALANHIDATASSAWNAGAGFVPVGDSSTRFTGRFDGLGHSIAALAINRPSQDYVGLFGFAGSGNVLRNVGLLGGSVTGRNNVGALVGLSDAGTISNAYATGNVVGNGSVGGLVGHSNYGTISNAYATGNVSGATDVGGLAGVNYGLVSNAYATGNVSGGSNVGGLVGYNNNYGHISNTYATGSVSGSSNVGGLVGYTYAGGTVSNSYWNTQTSGQVSAVGLDNGTTSATAGLNTAQMMTMGSFAGWSIANAGGSSATWRIYEGSTYPLLRSFLAPLTVTATSGSKVYDGTTDGLGVIYSATPDGTKLLGTLTYTGGSKDVGTGYTITPAGQYSHRQGYDLSYASGSLTITALPLTVGGSTAAASKVYDRSVAAVVSGGSVSGILSGDTAVSFVQSGNFDTWNVGVGKTVSYSNSLSGLGATNYSLSVTGGSTTANIAALQLTVGGSTAAASKVYDRSVAASVSGGSVSGILGGDTVSMSQAGSFANWNVGTGKTVSYSNSLTGGDAGNYSLSSTGGIATADIGPAAIASIIGITAANKIYDATATATLNTAGAGFIGMYGGDLLAVGSASGAFLDKNVGAGKAVTISGLTLAGADATNYTLAGTTASATADISALQLTVGGSTAAASKIYDRSVAAVVSGGSVSGILSGDTAVSFVQSGSFADWNVGVGKTVSYSNSLSGLDATNYSLSVTGGSTTANITALPLAVGGSTAATNKVYDRSVAAVVSGGSVSGILGGDSVSFVQAGTFADWNVGAGKTVTYSNSLSGLGSGNYSLSVTGGSTTANITQLPSVNWVAGGSGDWSTPGNWAGGAIPDGANVANVFIPTGITVVFDAANPATTLTSLASSGATLGIAGSSLATGSAVALAGYQQTGGSFAASNGLTVTQNFSQTGGSLAVSGVLAVNQASGDLSIVNSLPLTLGAITVNSGNLAVRSSGALTTTAPISAAGNVALDSSGGTINLYGGITASGTSATPSSINGIPYSGIAFIAGNVYASGNSARLHASAATGDISGRVAGDITLVGGARFEAGNDIKLVLADAASTLSLSNASHLLADSASSLPTSIYLDFPARSSGGVMIDGVETSRSAVGGSGLFVGTLATPATAGAGLHLTYVPVATVVTAMDSQVPVDLGKALEDVASDATPTTDVAPPPPETARTDPTKPPADPGKTVGGTEGSFGGETDKPPPPETKKDEGTPTTSIAKDEGAKDESAKDESAKDEKKDEKDEKDKKDKKDKKSDEAKDEKKDEKPAQKKVAQCM